MGNPALLGNRQGIHIGPQANDLAGAVSLAPEHTDNACPAKASDHLVKAEFAQLLGNDPRRAVDLEMQLRVLMEITSPCCHLCMQGRDPVVDRHGSGSSACQAGMDVSTRRAQ